MVDISGPFATSPWSEDGWFDNMGPALPSGVHGTPAASSTTGDLALSLSGLNWAVGAGRAMVRGAGFSRDAAAGAAATANTHSTWSRRDRIVLRRDRAAGTVAPVRIQGTPASSPSAPDISEDEDGQWDLKLFSFLVPPASGTATSGVVDERVWIESGSPPVGHIEGSGTQAVGSASYSGVILATARKAVGITANGAGLTVDRSGLYLCSGGIEYSAATGGRRVAGIARNGSMQFASQNSVLASAATSINLATAAYPMTLDAGDTVSLMGYQDSGSILNFVRGQCFLHALYLGPA